MNVLHPLVARPARLTGFALAVAAAALLAGCDAGGREVAVVDVPTGPRIAGQPQSLMVQAGEPAMFAVTGVMGGGGPGVRYQWRRDGIDIPGATRDHLVLGPTSSADDGARYSVVVTTPAGSTVSRPGVLAVSAGNEMAWR